MRFLQRLQILRGRAGTCAVPSTFGVWIFGPRVGKISFYIPCRLQLLELGNDVVTVAWIG